MELRYAPRGKDAPQTVRALASVERPGYVLLGPTRARLTLWGALSWLVGLVVVVVVVAVAAVAFGSALNESKANCLRRPVAQQPSCIERLADSITTLWSPYPWLVLVATLASLAVAAYVTVAVVRLLDERRRNHASLLVEERLGRLESAFVAGDVSEDTYAVMRTWLREAATLDASGDDAIQAGRLGRALALVAFPIALVPIAALFATAAFIDATPAGVVGDAAGAVVANPLLSNPILEAALRPVKEILPDATGAISMEALWPVVAPTVILTGILWVAVAVLSALLLVLGGFERDRQDEIFEHSWHLVLCAARDRTVEPRLPLDDEYAARRLVLEAAAKKR